MGFVWRATCNFQLLFAPFRLLAYFESCISGKGREGMAWLLTSMNNNLCQMHAWHLASVDFCCYLLSPSLSTT